ncbi:expressed unknown protein [Seminavis robusta]|uniref:Uncharacterized protein n=1 Tax=Seminavis robusta TaxID=568900 RepID=A0A9N8HXR2_9STRA|nr:expressed unknown protein [Seminavis robusta]|eukprot:Sro2285_g321920.1 n/a (443) ;mRNA; f:107-1435
MMNEDVEAAGTSYMLHDQHGNAAMNMNAPSSPQGGQTTSISTMSGNTAEEEEFQYHRHAGGGGEDPDADIPMHTNASPNRPNTNTTFELSPIHQDPNQTQVNITTNTGSTNHNHGKRGKKRSTHSSGKEVVVIVKSYYVSHSLRVPALLSSPKPAELETLSISTWYEIQAQLEPLIKRHLFLPKSYLLVPLLCILAGVGWFAAFSIAAAEATSAAQNDNSNNYNNNQQNYDNNDDNNGGGDDQNEDDQYADNYNDNYNYNNYQADNYQQQQESAAAASTHTVSMVFWVFIFFIMLTFVWFGFARWVAKRNHPVDDELREVCLELSRSKTQSEGYRLEYHKANYDAQDPFRNDLFATRVLRFVPLPIPRKITVPNTPDGSFSADFIARQDSVLSESTESSEFPTLQSLSTTDFHPFPVTDRILENLLSLLFVLVLFQCVNSLP